VDVAVWALVTVFQEVQLVKIGIVEGCMVQYEEEEEEGLRGFGYRYAVGDDTRDIEQVAGFNDERIVWSRHEQEEELDYVVMVSWEKRGSRGVDRMMSRGPLDHWTIGPLDHWTIEVYTWNWG